MAAWIDEAAGTMELVRGAAATAEEERRTGADETARTAVDDRPITAAEDVIMGGEEGKMSVYGKSGLSVCEGLGWRCR